MGQIYSCMTANDCWYFKRMELQKPNYDMLIVTLYILGFININ